MLYIRNACYDELPLVLQFLKDAAIWIRERNIDYWQGWLDPPSEYVDWITEGFQNNEFYLICQAGEAIGCFRLQWSDTMFWGRRPEPAGYIHSFTTARRLAGQHIGEQALALIEDICMKQEKDYLRLDCGVHVTGLCHYYEANGFSNVGETMVQGEHLKLYEKKICSL